MDDALVSILQSLDTTYGRETFLRAVGQYTREIGPEQLLTAVINTSANTSLPLALLSLSVPGGGPELRDRSWNTAAPCILRVMSLDGLTRLQSAQPFHSRELRAHLKRWKAIVDRGAVSPARELFDRPLRTNTVDDVRNLLSVSQKSTNELFIASLFNILLATHAYHLLLNGIRSRLVTPPDSTPPAHSQHLISLSILGLGPPPISPSWTPDFRSGSDGTSISDQPWSFFVGIARHEGIAVPATDGDDHPMGNHSGTAHQSVWSLFKVVRSESLIHWYVDPSMPVIELQHKTVFTPLIAFLQRTLGGDWRLREERVFFTAQCTPAWSGPLAAHALKIVLDNPSISLSPYSTGMPGAIDVSKDIIDEYTSETLSTLVRTNSLVTEMFESTQSGRILDTLA